MAASENEGRADISLQEEKELRRVFDKLCDFHSKQKIAAELQAKVEALNELQAQGFGQPSQNQQQQQQQQQQQLGLSGMLNSAANGNKPSPAALEAQAKQAEAERLTAEIADLKAQQHALETAPYPRIRAIDVSQNMACLGKRCSKKEVVDMVWEVDENLDGCVDWDEFLLMFNRNVNDQSGLEPSKLYNMVQFMMYDVNGNGLVSVDETMNMLYARYGRSRMEVKLRELFGEEMRETGRQGGEIDFLQYLTSVERTQLAAFLGTTVGKAQLAKKSGGHSAGKRAKPLTA